MKAKLLRVTAAACLAAIAIIATTACSRSAKSQLADAVAEVNKECPLAVADEGYVESIVYDDDVVTYSILMLSPYFDVSALKDHRDEIREAYTALLPTLFADDPADPADDRNKEMGDLLVKAGASLAIRFFNKGHEEEAMTITFTPEEIKGALAGAGKSEGDPRTHLAQLVGIADSQCPTAVDESTEMVSVALEGDNVVYSYIVSDSDLFAGIKEHENDLRQTIIENIRKGGDDVHIFLTACKEAGCNLLYSYRSQGSDECVEIAVAIAEI